MNTVPTTTLVSVCHESLLQFVVAFVIIAFVMDIIGGKLEKLGTVDGDDGKREGFCNVGETSNSAFDNGKGHEFFMNIAISEAKKASLFGDVPVGAVVTLNGNIIARAHNRREKNADPTAHAEILAIKKAAKKLGRWNLSDCSIYITLEPCAMCAGAIVNSRLNSVIFGAHDKRFGCGGSLYNLLNNSGLNHNANVISGIRAEECGRILSGFFASLRKR